MVEKEFSITYTHARLKSEKKSTYASIQSKIKRERERERKRQSVGGEQVAAGEREGAKYYSKRTWHATLFRCIVLVLSFFFFSLFSQLNQND